MRDLNFKPATFTSTIPTGFTRKIAVYEINEFLVRNSLMRSTRARHIPSIAYSKYEKYYINYAETTSLIYNVLICVIYEAGIHSTLWGKETNTAQLQVTKCFYYKKDLINFILYTGLFIRKFECR